METTIDNSVALTKDVQDAITPDAAIQMLKEGNKRFLENKRVNRDLHKQVSDTSTGQFPFAAVLGCIDSRVPSETIFDQGIGDIFNVRIAGNFVNEDILGSLEFACKVAGSKAILILGHTSCGAVKGAINDVELGNLTGMPNKIKPAVKVAKAAAGSSAPDSADFVQEVARANVLLNINAILEKSDVLREMHSNGEIAIQGGMYDVSTGKVEFLS